MKKTNEYDFYEQIKDWNFDSFQIETEDLTNWDLYEELKKVTNAESRVLDLGTGGGEKLIKSFPTYLKEVIGTDISPGMIATAKENLFKSGQKNIQFKVMDNLHLDFPANYFDVVVARNTVIDPVQIFKILKPGGYLLVRGVDKFDCHSLKMEFKRGQAFYDKTPISIIDYEAIMNAGFIDVELIPLHVREYFKNKELFKKFLLKVPIIDDFSEENENVKNYHKNEIEDDILSSYIAKNTFPKGIRLLRRYYGIIAQKSEE